MPNFKLLTTILGKGKIQVTTSQRNYVAVEVIKMKYLVNIMVFILVAGGVFFGRMMVDMSQEINDLETRYTTLQVSYNNLQSGYNTLDANYRTTLSNYNKLDANYNMLQLNFSSLQSDFQSLTSKYDTLESEYKSLESEHNELKSEVSSLRFENNQLELENSDLQRLINEYERVPHSYYSTDTFKYHENTLKELSKFLTSEFKLPRDYELNVFDCSESSAYLEWALENAGFMAEIIVGPDPSGEAGLDHAWVIVRTSDYQVAIEATALTTRDRYAWLSWGRIPGVIYGEDNLIDGWENYYEGYDESFKNIYMAIRQFGTGQEWNWWEGVFGFE